MIYRRYSTLIFLIFFCVNFVTAQDITPSILSTSGSYSNISGNNYSWSVGELAVSTISNGNNTITQGFLQPLKISNKIDELKNTFIKVFPNPITNFVNIDVKNNFSDKIQYYLTDISGLKILSGIIPNMGNSRLNLSGIKPGVYFLTFIKDTNQFTTYKIIKVNETF